MSSLTKKEWKELKKKAKILEKAAEILHVEEKDLPRVVERFQKEFKDMDDKIRYGK